MIGARFLARLTPRLQAVLRESSEAVAARARQLAPGRSGRLAASIETRAGVGGVEVVATAPYAQLIELGSARHPARPFLRPALLDEREALAARVRAALREMEHDGFDQPRT